MLCSFYDTKQSFDTNVITLKMMVKFCLMKQKICRIKGKESIFSNKYLLIRINNREYFRKLPKNHKNERFEFVTK